MKRIIEKRYFMNRVVLMSQKLQYKLNLNQKSFFIK